MQASHTTAEMIECQVVWNQPLTNWFLNWNAMWLQTELLHRWWRQLTFVVYIKRCRCIHHSKRPPVVCASRNTLLSRLCKLIPELKCYVTANRAFAQITKTANVVHKRCKCIHRSETISENSTEDTHDPLQFSQARSQKRRTTLQRTKTDPGYHWIMLLFMSLKSQAKWPNREHETERINKQRRDLS